MPCAQRSTVDTKTLPYIVGICDVKSTAVDDLKERDEWNVFQGACDPSGSLI